MKKLFILMTLIFVGLFVSSGYTGDNSEHKDCMNPYLTLSKSTELSARYLKPMTLMSSLTLQDTTREQRLAQMPGYKLPKRALFFSALIPGAGELYAKSYLKAAGFFAVEVAAWAFYGTYNQKGKDKEDEFQDYADEKWDPKKWYNWYINIDSTKRDLMTHASHMQELVLPFIKGEGDANKTQQYYEMIGKYAEFVVGWEGTRNDVLYEDLLQYRREEVQIADDYMKMRAKSNDLYEKARTGTTIVMLNHLLSAIDAAWSAKIHNNRLLEAKLEVNQIYYADHLQPVLSLKLSW
jgi:hypothetical protein